VQVRDPTGGIVDEHQQTAVRPAPFKPGVRTAVDLDQLAEARPALAQRINVRILAPFGTPQLRRDHDLTYGLLAQHNAVAFREVLGRQSRPKIAVMRADQRADGRNRLRREPAIARQPTAGRAQTLGAVQRHLRLEPAYLTLRQAEAPRRFQLRNLARST
jgi:hypothetical protein